MSIHGQEVKSIDDIYRVLAEWEPKRAIKLKRIRGKHQADIEVIPDETA